MAKDDQPKKNPPPPKLPEPSVPHVFVSKGGGGDTIMK